MKIFINKIIEERDKSFKVSMSFVKNNEPYPIKSTSFIPKFILTPENSIKEKEFLNIPGKIMEGIIEGFNQYSLKDAFKQIKELAKNQAIDLNILFNDFIKTIDEQENLAKKTIEQEEQEKYEKKLEEQETADGNWIGNEGEEIYSTFKNFKFWYEGNENFYWFADDEAGNHFVLKIVNEKFQEEVKKYLETKDSITLKGIFMMMPHRIHNHKKDNMIKVYRQKI